MNDELLAEAKRLGTATLYEAGGRIGALPSAIKPIASSMKVAGPAFTVSTAPNDNLWLHRALAAAGPGDVLVAVTGGAYEAGYWGEIMTIAAAARAIAGLVIDGSVRDGEHIAAARFPTFTRGLSIRGTEKSPDAPGELKGGIEIGGVRIEPGDLVVGDRDGVLVLPRDRADEAVALGLEREKVEAEIRTRLRHGETTLDVYGLE